MAVTGPTAAPQGLTNVMPNDFQDSEWEISTRMS